MFSCKHQQFIGSLLLAEEDSEWASKKLLPAEEDSEWASKKLRLAEDSEWAWKKLLHKGARKQSAKPRLSIVLLLSCTEMFFQLSLFMYVIGLMVYLGCVMTGDSTQTLENRIAGTSSFWF
jgi:hypothetical protein